MSEHSLIHWTDATWNPCLGCSKISPGCKGCYAILDVHRMAGNPIPKIAAANAGLTIIEGGHPNWTGTVRLIPERLEIPLHWKKPRRIFVNSLSDLFHESLPFEDIDEVVTSMVAADWHTYQILTKRSARMREYFASGRHDNGVGPDRADYHLDQQIWLGVSVESRDYLGRIDDLRQTPATVRFLSLEPLLEDLGQLDLTGIHWVIVGGESGRDARFMNPDWPRRVRDQCVAAGVPFFFKQWGEYLPDQQNPEMTEAGRKVSPPWAGIRVGKKKAGRVLDSRTWDEMP